MIPAVTGFDNPVDKLGEDAFKELDEAHQREIMGRGKLEAWQAGKFEFGQLTTQRPDDVYGMMRGEATLKELLGDE